MTYNLNALAESQGSTQQSTLGAEPLADMLQCENMSKMIIERVKLLKISEEGLVQKQPLTNKFDSDSKVNMYE